MSMAIIAIHRVGNAAELRLVDEHEVDRGQPEGIADPVPVDGDRPDHEGDGIGGEVDHPGEVYVDSS